MKSQRGAVVALRRLILVAAALFASVPPLAAQVMPQHRSAPIHNAGPAGVVLVLDGATVIDVEHGLRQRDQRVIIRGNRIVALGRAGGIHVPPGARVINARGKYLIPGLWDMHIHPTVVPSLPAEARSHLTNAIYQQLLANGVTGIRDAAASVPLDILRRWKDELANGRRVGPRLIVSGPLIETAESACTQPDRPTCRLSHLVFIADTARAQYLVDSIKAAGADMIKIHSVPRPIWFALAAAARRVGIPFGGHFDRSLDSLPKTIDGLVASDSGARILDHELWAEVCGGGGDTVLSLTQCTAAAARLRRNHTWLTPWGGGLGDPTLPSPHLQLPDSFQQRAFRYSLVGFPIADDAAWRPLTAGERRQLPTGAAWAAAWAAVNGDSARTVRGCQAAQLAYAAGLPWVPGTDWPMGYAPGIGVHMQMLNPVLCGASPLWSLQAATLEPARALQLTDSLGTVAAGKLADLVLLDGDPLEDIWNVSKPWAVIANGRYFDRAALDRLLVEASKEWRTVGAIMRQADSANATSANGTDKPKETNSSVPPHP